MYHSRYGSFGSTRQQGIVSVLTAFLLVLLLTVLALVFDTGRLYLEQRNLQKIADMAALDAIARLPRGYCAGRLGLAEQFAVESASLHGFNLNAQKTLVTRCAHITSQDGLRNVVLNPAGAGVRVDASHEVPASLIAQGGSLLSDAFSGNVILRANAAAQRNEPTAAFSVGSQLLRLNNNKLLSELLKDVGVNPARLTALDSSGIANISVTPAGLLSALGVDIGVNELALLSPDALAELVNTQVGLLGINRFIDASLSLVSDAAVTASLTALKTDIVKSAVLNSADFNLLGSEGNGLIQLASGSLNGSRAALDTGVNLGELLAAALMTGTSQNAIELPGLDLLGIKVRASVIEPPAIAVGPIGTKAYTGQVRLHADIDSNNLLANIPILGPLIKVLIGDTHIHLPLTLDVANAEGELVGLQCQADPPTADIAVTSSILDACIGEISEEHLWSGTESCSTYVKNTQLLTLLGLPVLSGRSITPGLTYQETLPEMEVGEIRSTQPNALQLGNTINNLTRSLLDLLGGLLRPPQLNHGGNLTPSQANTNQLIADVAHQYLEASRDSSGFYNVTRATNIILNGSEERDATGQRIIPALSNNWTIQNAIPRTCLLVICPVSQWTTGTFSEAFKSYTSNTYSVLDLVGISTLGNGYQSCAGLLSSLLNWNNCVRNNLTLLLQRKPGGLNLTNSQDGLSITNPGSNTVNCSGTLCLLLRPLLNIVKPILNGVGNLLTTTITDELGLELGRTDVRVESISCGVPTLVQ
ncbi:MAG: hypothetical protein KA748_15520 [Halomonas sp.]|nr:pilus assembly protein TadG-related protein [Halomonas sp.]MBP5981601.1 hypothetical protein [Halomonas sp.]